jgi:CIC family chloride channel protein
MAFGHPLIQKLRQLRQAAGFSPDWFLMPLAALIGALGGLVAAGFATLVESAGHALFKLQALSEGGLSLRAGLLLLAIPAAGGLVVGLLQFKLTRTGVINGVPEVIEALARERGTIKSLTGVNKAVTATATLSSGGSAGIEGPIITIGSALGSAIARKLRLKPEHMPTLIGCGAASATAGIFNAPIAGVLFVLEVILRDFSVRTFMPIVVAAVFGTAVAQQTLELVHAGEPANEQLTDALFAVPDAMRHYEFELHEAPAYLALGVACGLVGLALAGTLRTSNKLWQRAPAPDWLRPGIGGLMLGAMGLLFLALFPGADALSAVTGYDRPVFMGNGYPVIEALLDPASYHNANRLGVLVLLAVIGFKILGTALTIGSGGSGGVIAPSLFVGAATGGLMAVALDQLGIFPGTTPATYALAGMAGVIAATLHCPLTAFLLVFEITQDYKVILPVMLVAIVSTTCAQFLHRDSIYTDLLRRKGIRFGQLADMTLLRRMTVSDVAATPAVLVAQDDPAQRLIDLAAQFAVSDFVVADEEERYAGMVVGDDVRTTLVQREAVPLMIVAELMRSDLPTVRPGDTLDAVLDKFAKHEVSSLPIVDGQTRVTGMITRSRLLRHYQDQLDQRG